MATNADRQMALYEARTMIWTKMDQILANGQLRLVCGQCDDTCSCVCPCCIELDEAVREYLDKFQNGHLRLPGGVPVHEQHYAARNYVAMRFSLDREPFTNFVEQLWLLALEDFPSVKITYNDFLCKQGV